MDNDKPGIITSKWVGQESVEQFVNKLGYQRCKNILPILSNVKLHNNNKEKKSIKDANDALCLGYDLKQYITSAKPLPHKSLLTFEDLKEVLILLTNKECLL